jgi:hypothetical protein
MAPCGLSRFFPGAKLNVLGTAYAPQSRDDLRKLLVVTLYGGHESSLAGDRLRLDSATGK